MTSTSRTAGASGSSPTWIGFHSTPPSPPRPPRAASAARPRADRLRAGRFAGVLAGFLAGFAADFLVGLFAGFLADFDRARRFPDMTRASYAGPASPGNPRCDVSNA
jgi:hypothetical protein